MGEDFFLSLWFASSSSVHQAPRGVVHPSQLLIFPPPRVVRDAKYLDISMWAAVKTKIDASVKDPEVIYTF